MGTVSASSQGQATAGRGATIVAAVCSAALHGALAAGVFLWPAGPVPYSAGAPIVVELVVAAPQNGASAAAAAMGAASPDDGPAAEIDIAMSVQSGPDDVPPSEGGAAAPDHSREAATQAEPPAPPAAAPVIPRPARRPVTPPAEDASATPGGREPPTVLDKTADGTAIAALAGESPSSGIATGGDTPAGGDVAALPQVGPRFAIGSAGNPLPRYPTAARRRGLEGRVVLRVFVTTDGRAGSVSVRTASPHPLLDEAAIETLRRWRFEPARRAGVPVAAWVDIPITFRLND